MAKTYKGSLAHILALPPIDWALLAAEKRGYRHTPKTIAKQKAAMAKSRKAKRKRALKSLEAAAKPIRQVDKIDALATLLGSMEAGAWYGRSDIRILSGLKRGTVAGTIVRAEKLGLLERTKNPAWERPGGVECEFLYRRVGLKQQVADDIDDEGHSGDAATE